MKKRMTCMAMLCCMALLITSCDNNKGKAPQETASMPSGMPHAPQEAEYISLKGKVLEVTESGEFTYLKVQSEAGEKWVAVPSTDIVVGEEISITNGELFRDFPSKTLGRTFPELVVAMSLDGKSSQAAVKSSHKEAKVVGGEQASSFETALQKESKRSMAPMPGAGQQAEFDPSLLGSNKAIVPFVELKVEKASGKNGYTVGELFDNSTTLDGQKIRVRGQVVKVSMNIMGRNWVHIQDGTGNTLKNTHDLVVTTSAVPEMGDVVVVEGELHANRDFGAGYQYSVIIEDASISQ